jgi:hypothetical protein
MARTPLAPDGDVGRFVEGHGHDRPEQEPPDGQDLPWPGGRSEQPEPEDAADAAPAVSTAPP